MASFIENKNQLSRYYKQRYLERILTMLILEHLIDEKGSN
jgi:hypothetical protein